MKAIKILLANILFVQFTLAHQGFAATTGPGSTGGGDPVSQEMRAIITSLPSVLRSKGLQYFPEIQMEAFERTVSGTINIELKDDITVNGAPKAAQFDQARNLIQVSPTAWGKITVSENPLAVKRAIAFHEVLGLMGIEKNDQYNISNRLIGLEYLSMIGIKGTQNQLVPQDYRDPQVIYWRTNPDKTVTFFHCPNRNVVSSCRMLGTRSYTKQELAQSYKKLYASLLKSKKDEKKRIIIAAGTLVVSIAAVIAIGAVLGFGFFFAAAVVAMGTNIATMSMANGQGIETQSLFYQAERTVQAGLLKAGASRIGNFSEVVSSVNQMLINIDATSDLAPGSSLELGLK